MGCHDLTTISCHDLTTINSIGRAAGTLIARSGLRFWERFLDRSEVGSIVIAGADDDEEDETED